MKTIKLSIVSMSLLADGSAAVMTKPSKENPSENGVHVLQQGQVQRLCTRTLGFYSPIALKQAIAISAGSAILTIQVQECKAGDAWENKTTGETGVYTKDWTKYSNHEVELGLAATMKMFEIAATAGIQNAAPFIPAATRPAKSQLGITSETTGTVVNEEETIEEVKP